MKADATVAARFPVFLPDGRHFLFYRQGGGTYPFGIYLSELDTSTPPVRLTAAQTMGGYQPSGWLMWVEAGDLVAQQLNIAARAVQGNRVTLANAVAFDVAGQAAVSVSAAGTVAYRTGTGLVRRQLIWFDRGGRILGTLGDPDVSNLLYPSVSSQGRVVVTRTVSGNSDLWLRDGGRTARFTFDAGADSFPVWAPDGSRIVFSSDRTGRRNLYVKPAGGGTEQMLVDSPEIKVATDWSPDGHFLLYYRRAEAYKDRIWVHPMKGNQEPWPLLKTDFDERNGRFSPDGRWIAYQTDESGTPQIYVRSFASTEAAGAATLQRQVSTLGGIYPTWRPDGRELYYIGPDGAMMSSSIVARDNTLEPGTPVTLFPTQIVGSGTEGLQGREYDVTQDGRFLVNAVLESVATSPITLIQNWQPSVKN